MVMDTRRRSGQHDDSIVAANDPCLGQLLGSSTQRPGVSAKQLLWWKCACGIDTHVTRRTPSTVHASSCALRCYICSGDPPSGGIGGPASDGERRARAMVAQQAKALGDLALAIRVRVDSSMRTADMFLPQLNLAVHHDGSSHERLLPADRQLPLPKWVRDRLWDLETRGAGIKTLRLHWKDEIVWLYYFHKAVAECLAGNLSPVYTPHVCKG